MKAVRKVKSETKDLVTEVYSETEASHMFDVKMLTMDIQNFLLDEEVSLRSYLEKFPIEQPLVEVGCGYGRYLKFTTELGRHYEGIDLVPWLVKMGQARIRKLKSSGAKISANINTVDARDIEAVIQNINWSGIPDRPLVFFPFNCLGNIEADREIFQKASKCGLTIAVSTFSDNAIAEKSRMDYYSFIGLRDLIVTKDASGTLIQSQEGFSSWARSCEYFIKMAEETGYAIESNFNYREKAGSLIIFKPKAQSFQRGALKIVSEAKPALKVKVRVLSDHSETLRTSSTGMLLSFDYFDVNIIEVMANSMVFESDIHFDLHTTGQIIHQDDGVGKKTLFGFEVIAGEEKKYFAKLCGDGFHKPADLLSLFQRKIR